MTVLRQCRNCQSSSVVSISERIIGGRLAWSVFYLCPQCDYAEEVDGIGRLPEDLRESVMASDGKWNLVLESVGDHASKGLKALKDVLGRTIAEVSEMRQSLPTVIHVGTKNEANFYRISLLSAYDGIIAKVEPVQHDSRPY